MNSPDTYKEKIKRFSPHSHLLKNSIFAFTGGGFICALSEVAAQLLTRFMKGDDAYLTVTLSLILIGALLTGLGVFDKIARHLGAGTLVPVTGFANSVVSPALDTKSEGLILGVGANIFKVAGPVILYATLSGFIYGLIYFLISFF